MKPQLLSITEMQPFGAGRPVSTSGAFMAACRCAAVMYPILTMLVST